MNHWAKAAGLWIIFLSILIINGCMSSASIGIYKPDISPEAMATLDKLKNGGEEDVRPDVEELVNRHPSYVNAHRYLQGLYIDDNRYGYLMNRYYSALTANPNDPIACYLYGRLLSQPEDQIRYFERAVDNDSSFFWGYNGLGYAYRKAGNFNQSASAFIDACLSAPSRKEPYVGLISLYLAYRKMDETNELLDKVQKLFPDDVSIKLLHYKYLDEVEGPIPALDELLKVTPNMELNRDYFLTLIKALDKTSSDEKIKLVFNKFSLLAEEENNDPYMGSLDLLLGVCCRKLGYLSGALHYSSRVFAEYPANSRVRRELRFLYAVSGDIRRALNLQTMICPKEWTERSRYGKHSKRLLELEESLIRKKDWSFKEKEIYELSLLLTELGWLEEAYHYLFFIADSKTKTGQQASLLLKDILSHSYFEQTLKEFFISQYREFKKRGTCLDFDEVKTKLSEISKEILNKDIFDDCTFLDFSPAGMLLDVRLSANCKSSNYFRSFNRFFLMGQKNDGPVEAYLLDLYDVQPGIKMEVAGQEIEFDLVRCENLRIPSLIEFEGGNITGAGLHSILFLNIDTMRQEVQIAHDLYSSFRKKEEILLDDPAPMCEDDDVTNSDNHLGLASRLRYLSFKDIGANGGDSAYMESTFNSIYRHEILHLADATRFLPITKDLLWKTYQFISRGFSRFNIEAWLEERAQLHSLLTTSDPYGVLAEMADFIDGPSYQSPHRKGYHDLMDRIIAYIDTNQNLYPRIDMHRNILHQLYKLSKVELIEIAGILAREEEIIE